MSDWTNTDRIERARRACAIYDDPTDAGASITDLLADLRHFAQAEGLDFEHLASLSHAHFCEEDGEPGKFYAPGALARLREFLADAPLPVVDAQAVSDIIDGPRDQDAMHCATCGKVCESLNDADLCPDCILIPVHVRGGVAYCDDPRVEIIDHDNLDADREERRAAVAVKFRFTVVNLATDDDPAGFDTIDEARIAADKLHTNYEIWDGDTLAEHN